MAGRVGRCGVGSGYEDACFLWEDQWRGGAVGATILGLSDGLEGFGAKRGGEDSGNLSVLMVLVLLTMD